MIRDAQEADAERLAEITVDGWRLGYAGIVPDEVLDRQTVASHRPYFASGEALSPPMRTVVAEVGGRVVGYAHGGPVRPEPGEQLHGAELWGMYVDPGHGGSSWALMTAMCDHFRAEGHRHAFLWVIRDNTRARRFYEAAGWRLDPSVSRADPIAQVRYEIEL